MDKPKSISSLVKELPKSPWPASVGQTHGAYPFFLSGPTPKWCDEYLHDGTAIVLSTGGNAAIHLGQERFGYSTDCWALEPRPEEVFPQYLYYWLVNEQERIDILGFEGSGLRHLRKNYVRELSLLPPQLPEQEKIAEVLSTLDRAIEQTEALIAKQQRIKTGLMQDLLTKGIDAHGNIRSEATHAFKDSPLGRIPVEWDISPAENLCEAVIDCKNRTPPETADGHPVIRTPNVRNGEFVWTDLAFTDPSSYEIWTSRGQPRAGDVVITREAPFGEACIIPKQLFAPCLGQRMMMYQPDANKVRADYLVYAIYSQRVQKRLVELAGGSTVGHIRVGDIRTLPIPHPIDVKEQENIASALNGISVALKGAANNQSKLISLKAGLMRDLLTGERPVTALLAQAVTQ